MSVAPLSPICLHSNTSSLKISSAFSFIKIVMCELGKFLLLDNKNLILLIAQKRLTAVGLVLENSTKAFSMLVKNISGLSFSNSNAAKYVPYAAVTPIAGAPRTTISFIAIQTAL